MNFLSYFVISDPRLLRSSNLSYKKPFQNPQKPNQNLILNSDTDRGRARWVSVEVWMRACFHCVHVCTGSFCIDFCSHFLSILRSLYSSASYETSATLSSVLWGHCSRRYARAAFYKNYMAVAHKRIKVTCGRGGDRGIVLDLVSLCIFCRTCKLEVEGCSKGLRGQNKQRAWSFMLLQKILLSLKLPASRAKERGERQTGIERVRIGRAAREGEGAIEVWSPWVETVPAWAYRERMTVALVSFAELTVLLPYITPPIVLFQLFGEKS